MVITVNTKSLTCGHSTAYFLERGIESNYAYIEKMVKNFEGESASNSKLWIYINLRYFEVSIIFPTCPQNSISISSAAAKSAR